MKTAAVRLIFAIAALSTWVCAPHRRESWRLWRRVEAERSAHLWRPPRFGDEDRRSPPAI
jgi:hypothetical protein